MCLKLGNYELNSRLLLGTGKFADSQTMVDAVKASGTELVTVALRRFSPDKKEDDLLQPLAKLQNIHLMPNTSGACTAKEAVRAAVLAREISGSPFVKLEIHPNPHHLMPDPVETFEAAKELVEQDFLVMPYIHADPVLAKRLEEIGCASVMPLGSPIGSGQGLRTEAMLKMICENSNVPVIVDAGLRSPADAATAIESGCDAVLVNSAIAAAQHPVSMAAGFKLTIEGSRIGCRSGIMGQTEEAVPTSPLTSFLEETETTT